MVAKEGSCPLLVILTPNNLCDFKIIHISGEPTVSVDVFDGQKWKKDKTKTKRLRFKCFLNTVALSRRLCKVTEAETSWRPLFCCAEDETLPQRVHCGAHPASHATTAGDGGVKRDGSLPELVPVKKRFSSASQQQPDQLSVNHCTLQQLIW